MVETINWIQNIKKIKPEKNNGKKWKSIVQINEQCNMRKNNGKLEKFSRITNLL